MPQAKTAKDLPPGVVVETFWTTWTKTRPGVWTNGLDDTMTDAEVDGLLASGGMLTRVPTSTCPHRCHNCEGVDPQSCPFNPKEQ